MADAFISETKGTVGGEVSVYKPGDKFEDDMKDFAKKQERKLDDKLEETSDKIMDAIDALIAADKKRFEDFKKQQEEILENRRTLKLMIMKENKESMKSGKNERKN